MNKPPLSKNPNWLRGGCIVAAMGALLALSGFATGQTPVSPRSSTGLALGRKVHNLASAHQPPGVVGLQRRMQGGNIGSDYFQTIRFVLPKGAQIAPASTSGHDQPGNTFGLNVGVPYRFHLWNVPTMEGLPLFPSIELIDRTYPPTGQERRFAVPVALTMEDLREAANGNFVLKVVYIEDPDTALPVATNNKSPQHTTEASMQEDPLHVATALGRPIAIIRIGSKVPLPEQMDDAFLFNSPPLQHFGIDPAQPTRRSPLYPTTSGRASAFNGSHQLRGLRR